ncbi:MAG: SHOCT domain-containing protein [Desulfitobacteriaceae bacterium]
MKNFGGGYGFAGGFGHNIPVPNGGSGVVSNGVINIYSWVNLGLHFLFGIAVILLIAYIFKRLIKYPFVFSRHANKALELLNERYARGEIDTEEYQTRKITLGY